MSGRLDGTTMVVTGAAQGIGRAIAGVAAREGAVVAGFDVDADRGAAALAELVEAGHGATFHHVDVTDEEQVAAGMAEVVRRHGPVRVLVNNAGRNSYADPVRMTQEEWDAVFAVDLRAAWLCAKHALPGMIEARQGSIVNIASIHARLTIGGFFPYAAAKSGLVGLTRSMALEVGRHGIRVNAVSPGYVRTQLVDEYFAEHEDPNVERTVLDVHPMDRIGAPDEIAEVVCFLASDAASYVTGAEWAVDGGLGARFA